MKNVIMILGLLVFISQNFSCSSSKNQLPKNKDCQVYYQFIKKNWVVDNSYIFSFKGNPIYWTQANEDGSFKNNNQETYFKEKCLIGLSKKEVINLLGEPTRQIKNSYLKVNFITYCMQKDGAESKNLGGLTYGGISFTFDMKDFVLSFHVQPLLKKASN